MGKPRAYPVSLALGEPYLVRLSLFGFGLSELGAENQPNSQQHMALQVDDAQAARSWMKEKGFDIEETILIPGADRFFVRDPDGNLIEIIEWKEAYPNISISNDN